jgi:hypothetical protein
MERRRTAIDRSQGLDFFPDERGCVPLPVEDASDAAWAEYHACCRALEQRVRSLQADAAQAAHKAIARAAGPRASDLGLAHEWSAPPAPLPQLPPLPPPTDAADAKHTPTLEEVLSIASIRDRICPLPAAWSRLYLGLLSPGLPATELPPFPVDRASWRSTEDFMKRQRFREQVEWAQSRGLLDRVHAFVSRLGEPEWHHLPPLDWPRLEPG